MLLIYDADCGALLQVDASYAEFRQKLANREGISLNTESADDEINEVISDSGWVIFKEGDQTNVTLDAFIAGDYDCDQ